MPTTIIFTGALVLAGVASLFFIALAIARQLRRRADHLGEVSEQWLLLHRDNQW